MEYEGHARKVTARVAGQLVVRERAKRPRTHPPGRVQRDRQRELRVQPLDLEDRPGVGVQVEAAGGAEACGRRVALNVGVVAPGLAEVHVELETEDSLCLADLTDDVEPTAGAAVRL